MAFDSDLYLQNHWLWIEYNVTNILHILSCLFRQGMSQMIDEDIELVYLHKKLLDIIVLLTNHLQLAYPNAFSFIKTFQFQAKLHCNIFFGVLLPIIWHWLR